MQTFLNVILAILVLVFALAAVRLVRGPRLADRAVALDLIGYVAIGMIAVYAVLSDQKVLLDVALALALVAFLGTVALAYYILLSRTGER